MKFCEIPNHKEKIFNLPKKYNEDNRLLSASFVGLFSDKFYVLILSFLCSFVCIIVFGISFVKVVGRAYVTYILVCELVSILPSRNLYKSKKISLTTKLPIVKLKTIKLNQ